MNRFQNAEISWIISSYDQNHYTSTYASLTFLKL